MAIKSKEIKKTKKQKVQLPKKQSLKENIIKAYKLCMGIFCRFWNFATAKPNEKENMFQYIFRQMILTDSSGNPSWTITILFFVMTLNAVTLYIEYKLALSPIITYTPEGGVASYQLKGISTEFYYLLLSLSVVITGLFRARQKQDAGNIIDTAKDVITKIKAKF